MQRHCVIQLDSTGKIEKLLFFSDLKSPWTDDLNKALELSTKMAKEYSRASSFEVITEDYEPIEIPNINGEIPQKYRRWIQTNVLDDGMGLCLEWSGLMVQAFPELRLIAGWYQHTSWEAGHYWCETKDGIIIDPTVNQFIKGGSFKAEGPPEATGKCVVCNASTYLDNVCCSVYCWEKQDQERS